jgi:hypothetical protein
MLRQEEHGFEASLCSWGDPYHRKKEGREEGREGRKEEEREGEKKGEKGGILSPHFDHIHRASPFLGILISDTFVKSDKAQKHYL